MLEQTLGVSSPQQNKKKRKYQHILTDIKYSRYSPTLSRLQSFRFLSVETLQNLRIFSSNLKLRDSLLTHF